MPGRKFLKPRSVNAPAQGEYHYIPIIIVHESDTAQGLEDLFDLQMARYQAETPLDYFVVESVSYTVNVLVEQSGGTPAVMSYSALAWITKCQRVTNE
jgi:hypothetical protein